MKNLKSMNWGLTQPPTIYEDGCNTGQNFVGRVLIKQIDNAYRLGTVVSRCTLSHLSDCKCHVYSNYTVEMDWLF